MILFIAGFLESSCGMHSAVKLQIVMYFDNKN